MLETLKDLVNVNGKPIMTDKNRYKNSDGSINWEMTDKMRDSYPICVDHEKDMVSFKMLTKPAKEGGNLDLCQFTDLISVGLEMLKYLNKDYPCRENSITITKLEEALMWQEARTKDREKRGVEGKYEK